MSIYQGFVITLVLMACAAASAAPNEFNSNATQTQGWSYEQFADGLTAKAFLTAGLEGSNGMHIAIEQHPRFGSCAYIFFLLQSGKAFDCERSCVMNIRFDDGVLESWPVLGPRSGPSVGLSLAQVEELISRLKNPHHFMIEAPVLSAGKTSFDFYSQGIVWPPPRSAVSIRAEGTPLAEKNGLHAGGINRWLPVPMCFYLPNPPITKEATPANLKGTVEVEAKVTVEGTIENFRTLKSPGLGLDELVIETMKTWKCKPAIAAGGEPLPVTVTFQIKFGQ